MTSSNITPIDAAGRSGDTTKRMDDQALPVYGLFALRHKEGRGLISLVCDALHETSDLAHKIHDQLYAKDLVDYRALQLLNVETQACLESAEHYLLMLGSVIEERIPSDPGPDTDTDPWSVEPAF
jgi:hypothetical protein